MKTLLLSAASYLTLANGLPATTLNGMMRLFWNAKLDCPISQVSYSFHLSLPLGLGTSTPRLSGFQVTWYSRPILLAPLPLIPVTPSISLLLNTTLVLLNSFSSRYPLAVSAHPQPPCLRVFWMQWLSRPSIRLNISTRVNQSCSLTTVMTSTTTAEDTQC